MKNFLVRNGRIFAEWGTFLGVILALIGLFFTYNQLSITNAQLEQGNFHKRWQNYNELNLRYAQLYDSMPDEMAIDSGKEFSKLSHKAKRWVRRYFNLYSEEYWLYQNGLMPEEMWTQRIKNGVKVNLETYPVMVKGYFYWKKKGSFKHPKDFIHVVEMNNDEIIKKISTVSN